MEKTNVIGSASARNNGDVYQTAVMAGAFPYTVDEPEMYGGKGLGPSPADCLCMALASCKAITIRMYAQRKGWNVADVAVQVNFVKGDEVPSGQNTFYCEIKLTGDLTEEQRQRILQIAKVCPVERLLGKPNDVVTVLQ